MQATGFNGSAPPRVVIIGGGATGTGIARDAAARGYDVVLIDRGELGSGTSGNFHGILHSGARYVVNDPAVAAECYRENQILRKLVPSAITNCGGMFVALNQVEARHSHVLIKACESAGIPIERLSIAQALQREPHLSPNITAAFTVPDGFIDGVELIRINRLAAVEAEMPATILANHDAIGITRDGNKLTAVTVRDTRNSVTEEIPCDFVVNAAGVWAGSITGMVNLELEMVYDKGTMLILKQQYSSAVLNRCRPEDDGDLLVPSAGHSIMGTTSTVITDLDDHEPTWQEVDLLMEEGTAMVPSLRSADVLFAYAGIRPLFQEKGTADAKSSRAISRSFKVLDHAGQGIDNFISIVGGKVTLYRRMAEAVVDLMDTKAA